MSRWLVIGISGVTCSGKTTLSQKLSKNLSNVTVINQDTYFRSINDPHHVLVPELNHFNFDILSSLDMEKMHSDILQLMKSTSKCRGNDKTSILIIDGFQFYNYKPIADLCHMKFFLYLTKDECFERRKVRVYNPPDPPGYFDKIVWPEYEKYKIQISNDKHLNDVVYLDGSKHPDETFKIVLNNITSKL